MDRSRPNRQSTRLPHWDYRKSGIYFVTICTHQRRWLFDDPMLHEIATNTWARIPTQPHAQHTTLDEWVVMHNHIHGLIEIIELPNGERRGTKPSIHLKSGSLGSIIGNYKMLVTKRIKGALKMSGQSYKIWQRGYWERVVRDERELDNIRRYIRENPLRWAEERDNIDQILSRMSHVV